MIHFTGRRVKAGAIAATAAVAVSALALSHAGTAHDTATRQAGTAHGTTTRAASVAAGSTAVSLADQVAASSYNGSVSNNSAGATVYDYPGSGTLDTSLAALGTLADGTQVSIQCYLTGTPVTGPNGQGPGNSDAYWDQVAGASTGLPGQVPAGHAAVVPDAYIDTGSETVDQLVPACGAGSSPEASPAAGGSPASAGAGTPASSPPAEAPIVTATPNSTGSPSCTTGYQPSPGFNLDVCLAQNGNTVTPSVVVHQLGAYSSCTLALEIWDDAGNRLDRPSVAAPACAIGQITGAALDLSQLSGVTAHTSPDGSLTVHAFARLTIDGQSIYISGQGDSPSVTALTPVSPAPNPAADPPAALQNPNTVSGCTDWPTTKYLQTPLVSGSAAVGGNAYGQGDHTRCNSTSFINQYYAVDVEVPDGTPLRAPGGAGTVLWAGPAPGGWASCGNEVVMNYGGGYWSVQCHLGTIYAHTGQTTNNDTVIALSGNSGLNPANGQPWGPHLHFALFKGASMTPNGGVYGGQSAKAHHMRYFAGGGGYYEDLDYNDFSNGLTISN